MPIAAIIIGILLIDVAFRGTEHKFATQLGQDFGQGSQFWSWAAAIGIIGALGYVDALRKVSNLLLGLIIIVMVLRNGGLFAQLAAVIKNPPQALPAVPLTSYKDTGSSSSSGGSQTTLLEAAAALA